MCTGRRLKRVARGDLSSFTRNCLLCQAGPLLQKPPWCSFPDMKGSAINSLSPVFYNTKSLKPKESLTKERCICGGSVNSIESCYPRTADGQTN